MLPTFQPFTELKTKRCSLLDINYEKRFVTLSTKRKNELKSFVDSYQVNLTIL